MVFLVVEKDVIKNHSHSSSIRHFTWENKIHNILMA